MELVKHWGVSQGLVLLLVILGLWFFMGPSSASSGKDKKMISAQELNTLIKNKDASIYIVDVREPDELKMGGKIKEAVNIPLSVFESKYAVLPKDKTLVMVCRSGNRSGKAQSFLINKKYPHVLNMSGGMMTWQAEGLPIAK